MIATQGDHIHWVLGEVEKQIIRDWGRKGFMKRLGPDVETRRFFNLQVPVLRLFSRRVVCFPPFSH